jgi:hypothetical protein
VGIRKYFVSRAQGTHITLREGPAGKFGRCLVYGGLEKFLETGIFVHRGPVKDSGGGGGFRSLGYLKEVMLAASVV